MYSFIEKLVKQVRALIGTGVPVTDDERLICKTWLVRRDEALARTMLYYGLFFHSTSMFIHPLLVNPSFQKGVFFVHFAIFTCELMWVAFLRKQKVIPVTHFVLAMEFLAVASFGVIAQIAYNSPATSLQEKIYATNAFITITSILTIVMPFHNRVVPIVTGLYFLIGIGVTFDGTEVSVFWVNLLASLLVCALILHWAHTALTRVTAIRELRTRAGIAPLQMVRRSVTEDTSVESIFAPKLRFCVCISSDWRSFQELTSRMDAKTVASALSSYYQICNEELRSRFPSGNYYSDWIADELFIVLFTDNPLETMQLTKDALEFSRKILERKAVFVIDHDFPFAIDIGMSVGQAMVGMMGPVQHRKATALGEVPGRSRRLQATGKLLRYHFGEKDRVIFDEDFADTLPNRDDVKSYTIGEGRKLRDLNCRTLNFVELEQNLNDLLISNAG